MVRITIRSTIGGQPPIVMDINPSEKIGDVKQRVARMRGLDPGGISFALRGKVLNDFNHVKDTGIVENDTVFMLLTNIVQGGKIIKKNDNILKIQNKNFLHLFLLLLLLYAIFPISSGAESYDLQFFASGDHSYQIGDVVTFSGISTYEVTDTKTTQGNIMLILIGDGLPDWAGEGQCIDIGIPVSSDKTWKYQWTIPSSINGYMINPGRYFVRAYDASYRHGGQQHYREISIVIANPTTITKQTPTVRPTPRTNDFPEGSSAILIIVAISIVVVISFLIMRKRCNVSREDTSSGISPVTPSQPSVLPTPPSSPNVADLPERFLPHIDRLIQSQPKPLESLDKFYAYLELEGFTLTPELKDLIRKKIESILDEKEKDMKKQQISAELFGTPAAINPPLAPQPASGSQVIPLPTVPPGSTCQVCLSEFSSAEPGAVKCPHCGNLFHYRCIAKWINKNGTCPVCKKDLKA